MKPGRARRPGCHAIKGSRAAGQPPALHAALYTDSSAQQDCIEVRRWSTMRGMDIITFRDETIGRARMQAIVAAHPRNAVFEDCTFDEGDFSRLDMDGFQFVRCSVAGASWLAASLEETQWTKCRGGQCDFSSALLSDARFSHCDLNNSHWRRATLSSVRFEDCKLTGAHLQEVTGWALEFRDCLLVSADLRGLSFRKAELVGMDFSDAELSGCDFRDAVFEGGSLRNAQTRLTRFEGADLRGADITGLNVMDAKHFKKAVISQRQAAAALAAFGLIVA
ncbi:pentapeptide repeat-containing protein [Stenotrophomonas sp. VV52]|uniref:pentapeptide repeat-containing protein n=1 Tax=Stenotrophomonas sp. VV52 TaxID=2066958 RepID=UPI00209BD6C6|nr:pentapeptide repeat-containing protein [Stenotrophomonas sp. VV52]